MSDPFNKCGSFNIGDLKLTLKQSKELLEDVVKMRDSRIAELEAENEKLEDTNWELLDKIVWLKAEVRRLEKAVKTLRSELAVETGNDDWLDDSDNNPDTSDALQVSCTCGEINARHCQIHQDSTEEVTK